MYPLQRQEIAPGVFFNTITDKKFKTNRISVNMFLKLDKETASEYAIVPLLLRKGYAGCPDMTQLNRKLMGLYGAFLGGDVRKIGDNQVLTMSLSFVDDQYALDGEPLSNQAAEILSSVLLDPVLENGLFRQSDVELEKKNLIDMIESEINDKRVYAINRLVEIMCHDEPYGINKYGSVEAAKELNAERVTKAYYRALETADIQIMYVGSGDSTMVKDSFARAISTVKRNNPYKIKNEIFSREASEQETTEYFQVAQSKMVLGFRVADIKGKMLHATRLMGALYGGTPFSKLFLNVREKLSLCYYCAAQFDRVKGIMTVDCGVENQNIEKAKDEILRQLDSVRKGEFTPEEVEKTKLSLENMLQSVGDSLSGAEQWYLMQICCGTSNTPQEEIIILKTLTREDIIKAAENVQLNAVYVLTGKETDQIEAANDNK